MSEVPVLLLEFVCRICHAVVSVVVDYMAPTEARGVWVERRSAAPQCDAASQRHYIEAHGVDDAS